MARKALLIGINRYDVPGADLRGCVNDCKNLRDALLSHFGFTPTGISLACQLRPSDVERTWPAAPGIPSIFLYIA